MLIVLVLLPLLALLPLGLRAAIRDYGQWADAAERSEASEQFSALTRLEEAVQSEWLIAVDASGLASSDVAGISPLYAERLASIGFSTEATLGRFGTAVLDTEQAVQSVDVDDALAERLDLLASMRDRVGQESLTPAESDLTYSRLVRMISDRRAALVQRSLDRAPASAFDAVEVQSAFGDLTESSNQLRQELTLAVERGINGGQVDWLALAAFADQFTSVDDGIRQLGFLDSPDSQAARLASSRAAAEVAALAEVRPAAGSPMISDAVLSLVDARQALSESQPELTRTRIGVVETLVASAADERTSAQRALAISATLVALGALVATFAVSRTYVSIVEPLGSAAAMARKVSQGEIPEWRTDRSGPTEVRDVVSTLDDLVDTVSVIQAQAVALNHGELESPDLERRLPGELGRALESSIGTWRETTLRLDHELAHDSLTGIASSRRIRNTVEEIVASGPVTVIEIGLDRFKDLNDSTGQATGDAVLCEVAQRLETTVDESGVVGRLWSDEFAVVITGDDVALAARLGDRLRSAVKEPIAVGAAVHRLTATVGVASGDQADVAVTNAAIALREGKRVGGDQTVVHDEVLGRDLERRSEIEAELIAAMASDDLDLHYQPVVDATTGAVTSVEALIRWPQPDGTVRMPGQFIPIAEQSDLILEVDRWVMRAACRDLAAWTDGPLDDIGVSINVSGRHLAEGDVPAALAAAAHAADVDPSRLAIEVTETYLAGDRSRALATLNELTDLGIRLLVDDFGTGYSSMAFIQDLPFDVMKIDRAFIQRFEARLPGAESVIRAMVSIAESSGMAVLAEGVEDVDVIERLAELGCGQIQGYAIARPIATLDQLVAFVVANRATPTGRRLESIE